MSVQVSSKPTMISITSQREEQDAPNPNTTTDTAKSITFSFLCETESVKKKLTMEPARAQWLGNYIFAMLSGNPFQTLEVEIFITESNPQMKADYYLRKDGIVFGTSLQMSKSFLFTESSHKAHLLIMSITKRINEIFQVYLDKGDLGTIMASYEKS